MLNYPIQSGHYLLGGDDSAETLTAAYADNMVTFNSGGMSQIELYFTYVPGEDNAVITIQFEGGMDEGDLYKQVFTKNGATITTLKINPYEFQGASNGTTYKFRLSLPIADKVTRFSVKETATTYGTIKLKILASGL